MSKIQDAFPNKGRTLFDSEKAEMAEFNAQYAISSRDAQYKELIIELTQTTHGHGAFGEYESYPPSDLQVRAARAIEELLNRLKFADL